MNFQEFTDSPCNLCPRNCHVNRELGETGFCMAGSLPVVARASLHFWEEPCISGKTGSGTVFFSGCNLRCIYCQNFKISKNLHGSTVSIPRLAEIFLSLQEKGAANINLVTPDHYVVPIVQAILLAKQKGLTLPIVYNCSGYEKRDIIERLKGIADIFLTDLKYMEETLAAKYSSAPDYPDVAKKALEAMVKTAGAPLFDGNGMMQKGVIVRHLLLPGQKQNAKKVIQHVHETYGNSIILSIMNQYTPFAHLKNKTGCETLCRKVTKREYNAVIDYALSLGVENAFIQEGETAKESFIPDFHEEEV